MLDLLHREKGVVMAEITLDMLMKCTLKYNSHTLTE